MKLQVKIFIVLILLLIASLLVLIDKFQAKVDMGKIHGFTNIHKFSMKVNEPTSHQIAKIVQNIDDKEVQKEHNGEKNTYIPTEKEDDETNEEYSKSKSENIYIVQTGDTFYSISKKFYQTSKYANKLFEYNKEIVRKPENLRTGMQLKIPEITVLEKNSKIARQ